MCSSKKFHAHSLHCADSAHLSLREGALFNIFLPFRLGESGRVFLLSRKPDLPFADIRPFLSSSMSPTGLHARIITREPDLCRTLEHFSFCCSRARQVALLIRLPVLNSRKVKPAMRENESLEPHGLHSPKARPAANMAILF